MESDIQADREGYGNDRRIRSANMAHTKFSTLEVDEDQVDSGLGSIGYYSGDHLDSIDSLRGEKLQQIHQGHDRSVQSKRVDSGFDIVDSLRGLDIHSKSSSVSDRFDSGIEDYRSTSISSIQNDSWAMPAPSRFTPEQILTIFMGDEDGDK